ncbi:hypothetical protein [Georgenia sp. MJ170]|uniref:hypothetical protein n=1 Tax=Georgenia sunbinii TaxID=3117728 RepID=UPI002F26CFF4
MTTETLRREDYEQNLEAAGWIRRHGFERVKDGASLIVTDDGPAFALTVTTAAGDLTHLEFPGTTSARRIVRTALAVVAAA